MTDDHVDGAMSLALLLELWGCEARVAHDGLEALEVAADFAPHIIFVDIRMPRLDGFEVTRRLREMDCCKNTVIVALTAFAEESDRAQSRAAGMNDHLAKPARLEDLKRVLEAFSLPLPTGQER